MDSKKMVDYSLRTTNWRYLRPGLTIVELTVGLAVLGLMVFLVASVYFTHFRLFSNQNTSIDVNTQNRLALDEITNQIRESQAVASTCSSCSGDNTGSSILILQLWPLDASGEPYQVSPTAYDYIEYKRNPADNTKLIKKVIADPSSSRKTLQKVIASYLSDLQFTYNNADVTQASEVTVSITTTANSFNKTLTTTQSSKAILRNK